MSEVQQFFHKHQRFSFPVPGKEEERQSRASIAVWEAPDDLERDPDAWIVEWHKQHPCTEWQIEGDGDKTEGKDDEKEEEDQKRDSQRAKGVLGGVDQEAPMTEKEKARAFVVKEGRGRGLIRLTGQHPLNAEPPLGLLLDAGPLTPSPLHYVRNHGPVPRLDWESHRVHVCGMVERPTSFSMQELAELPSIEIPVTMVCDGNRRKELNSIRRSKGFDWGSGGLGTSVWKGVPLSLVLKRCGVKPGARFVIFEGAEKLSKGHYGTSIPVEAALDEKNDMMLAYEMNHQRLPPDHGYPVRVVLPGYVGGRMVKWLTKIEVSEHESNHWHHYHDNRVLPPGVNFTNAESGRWWYKPETLLYHLNVNSVIASPGHEEFFSIEDGNTRYKLRGYAYAGGGREIRRVEITLDGGKSWIECERHYPPDHMRHGIHSWVWCHWTLELAAWKLLKADEIAVRAFDSQFNTQPSEPTWNLTGMMNNCWYRVKVEVQDAPTVGSPACTFTHPVQPGGVSGGWMIKPRDEPKPARAPQVGEVLMKQLHRQIPVSEIRKHNKEEDCWVMIDGRVYDMTPYFKHHPGGVCPVVLKGGQDASKEYYAIHAQDSHEIKEYFCIGWAVDDLVPPVQVPATLGDAPRALDPHKWIDITLVSKEEISHDTRKFRFKLPGPPGVQLGLPVGLHVLLGAYIGDQLIVRPYTPIGPVMAGENDGHVEFVIKIYFRNQNKAFPQGGLMTQYIEGLKIGDKLKMKGPAGHVVYHGRGRITTSSKPIQIRHISMVAGGTGITPIYQLARAICKDSGDDTRISLLYANHTPKDILLRKELDGLARDHPQFKVWYTVSEPPPKDWRYSVGRVVEHMLKARLFPAGRDAITLLCGPPAMIEMALIPGLSSLGYTDEDLFEF